MAVLKTRDPVSERGPRLFSYFELDRSAGLVLNHGRAIPHPAAEAHVIYPEGDQSAAAQLAVDRDVEQREIAAMVFELKPDPDCPDLLRLERTLLADQPTLVPRCFVKADNGWDRRQHRRLIDFQPPPPNARRQPAAEQISPKGGSRRRSGRLRLLRRDDEKRRFQPFGRAS